MRSTLCSTCKAAQVCQRLLLAVGPEETPFQEMAKWAQTVGMFMIRVPDLRRASQCMTCAPFDVVLPVLGEQCEEDLDLWVEALRGDGGCHDGPRLLPLAQRPTINLTLRALQMGVSDVLPISVPQVDFLEALGRVGGGPEEGRIALPEIQPVNIGPYALVAESVPMIKAYKTIGRVAPSETTVLLLGDSGTGKELAARAIHFLSPRASKPFVAVNCAAIPENLLESELFGHEKGAFTGAVANKVGRFERANGGTLFLDEIGDMSHPLQSKILRALQEHEIERVGGRKPIPINARLIAATNGNLRNAIDHGRFREDLYYRLAVVTVQLPRLAERIEDLLPLTAHFVSSFCARCGKSVRYITERALALMRAHPWAGNVRELQNVIERAVLVAGGDTIRAADLPETICRSAEATPAVESSPEVPYPPLREVEAQYIGKVLEHCGGQRGTASRILGIHRNTLTRKIKEHCLP